MSKTITINDFKKVDSDDCVYIEWKEIERVLGKRKYKQFDKWMNGQTCVEKGAFTCDVENFLRKENQRFFD